MSQDKLHNFFSSMLFKMLDISFGQIQMVAIKKIFSKDNMIT